MRGIQSFLPDPRHTEVNRIFVEAKPDIAWEAIRHFDGASISWIKLLFRLRDVPNIILGKSHPDADDHIGIDQIAKAGTGFHILNEIPGKEVIIGSIGRFWQPHIIFKEVPVEDFESFDEAGWGKLAWSITVEPYLHGSTICLELRTTATDDDSWHRLQRYYRVIGIGSKFIRGTLMSHYEAQLKKMKFPEDDVASFAGDDIIPKARHTITYHTNIEAPPSIVWRYLMQLGCDRAGWYSIDWIDHDDVPSTDHLVDAWTDRHEGDRISATPKLDSFYEVYDVKTESHFVIGGETTRMGGPFKMTWAFILNPIGDDATHLVSRARMESEPKWAEWVMGNILYPPIHILMSSAQLHNLKRLAERDARKMRNVAELVESR